MKRGGIKKKKKWVEIKLYYNVSTIPGKFMATSLLYNVWMNEFILIDWLIGV
jgi:hypothetical protein